MEQTIMEQKLKIKIPQIQNELVYEIINKKLIYYKGFEEVIKQNKLIESIIGNNSLTVAILSVILEFFFNNITDKKYQMLTNLGLEIDNENNLLADLSIIERKKFNSKKIEDKFLNIPPKIIIDVDTRANINDFNDILDYFYIKTNKLFNFGVEKVFWILTKNKQIIEAVPNKNWLIKTWDKEIVLFDNIKFTLNQLLKEDGIYDLIY